jgi:uncharacterized protein YndB with AHSA1/START domain
MTIAAEIETRIERVPGDVFPALLAVEEFPRWLIASGITRVQVLDEGPVAVGSRVRIAQSVGGRSTVLEGRVTKLDQGRAFGLEARDPDGVTIEIEAALQPDGTGTRLRWSLRIGLPLRFRMFESMVAPQVRRAATLDLEAFRRRLESAAAT